MVINNNYICLFHSIQFTNKKTALCFAIPRIRIIYCVAIDYHRYYIELKLALHKVVTTGYMYKKIKYCTHKGKPVTM